MIPPPFDTPERTGVKPKKRTSLFEDTIDKLREAMMHADAASALAAEAVSQSKYLLKQMQPKTQDGLASATAIIAAAATMAKTAAAAANVAANAALLAETNLSSIDQGEGSPASILEGEGAVVSSSSVLNAERSRKRVEAATTAIKQAEVIISVTEAAYENVSQAEKNFSVCCLPSFNQLVEAGQVFQEIQPGQRVVLEKETVATNTNRDFASPAVRTHDGVSGSVSANGKKPKGPKDNENSEVLQPEDGFGVGESLECLVRQRWVRSVITKKRRKDEDTVRLNFTETDKLEDWVALKGEGDEAPKTRTARSVTGMPYEVTVKGSSAAIERVWDIGVGESVKCWVHDRWVTAVITKKSRKDVDTVRLLFEGDGLTLTIIAMEVCVDERWSLTATQTILSRILITRRSESTFVPTEKPESLSHQHKVTFSEHESKAYVGLTNLGSTCYLNAILQCLTHTTSLVARLGSFIYQSPCLCGNDKFCVVKAIHGHIQAAMKTSSLSPVDFVQNLTYFSSVFKPYEQADAHEFFIQFLARLKKCCFNGPRDVSSEDTIVEQVFGGSLIRKLRCCNCNSLTVTYEPYNCLSLDIENEDSLLSALQSYVSLENLEDQSCNDCMELVSKEKQYLFHEPPLVATFHLKRFRSNRGVTEKITRAVRVPFTLDLQPYAESKGPSKYNLYAFVNHKGSSLDHGHYISYARTAPKMWHQFDDLRVDRINEDCVQPEDSYILFYAREEVQPFHEVSPKSVLHPTNRELQQLEMESEEEQKLLKVQDLNEEGEQKRLAAELEESRKLRILKEIEERKTKKPQALLEDTKKRAKKGRKKHTKKGNKNKHTKKGKMKGKKKGLKKKRTKKKKMTREEECVEDSLSETVKVSSETGEVSYLIEDDKSRGLASNLADPVPPTAGEPQSDKEAPKEDILSKTEDVSSGGSASNLTDPVPQLQSENQEPTLSFVPTDANREETISETGEVSYLIEDDKSGGSATNLVDPVGQSQPDQAAIEDQSDEEAAIEYQSDEEAATEYVQVVVSCLEELMPSLPLDAQGTNSGYIHCFSNFFTIPEMKTYMTTVHGQSREAIAKVLAPLRGCEGGKAYLRYSALRRGGL